MLAIDILMFLGLSCTITTIGTIEIYRNIEKKYYMEAADKGFKEASDAPNFVDGLLLNSFSSLPKMILCTFIPFLNLIIATFKSIGINKERRLKIITNSVKKHWLIEMNGKEKEYYQKHRSYATLQKIKRPQITFSKMPEDMSIIELNASDSEKDTISYNDTELSKKIDDILNGDVVITESDVDLFRVIKTNRWPNRYLELKEKIKAIKDLDLDSDKENQLIMEILKSYRQEELIDNINNDFKVKKIKR